MERKRRQQGGTKKAAKKGRPEHSRLQTYLPQHSRHASLQTLQPKLNPGTTEECIAENLSDC